MLKSYIKRFFMIGLILMFILTATACSSASAEGKYDETQLKMDTVMTITAYGSGAEAAVKDAFKRIDEIEQSCSLQVSTSDVNRINNAAGSSFVPVGPDVLKIIKKALEYSKMSGGAFDITVGPITSLWKLGTNEARVPSPEEIKAKLPLVGYEKIKLDDKNNSVMLEKPGMIIDLGGIAKGYAASQAVDILKSHGIKKAIVNLGGSSVYVIGSKDNNLPWSIGLQHPRLAQGAGFLGIIKESDKAISTSGDYERYIIKDGKRYHHIIDPKTGYPAESGVIADTVVLDSSINNNPMNADGLSTIVFILGPEKGMQFIKNIQGAECIIVTSDKKLLVSPGLKGKIDSISEDFKYDPQG